MPTSALHVARTGLEAQDARMRVIANNLANIGTTGFKRDRVDFATLAYQEQRVAGQASTGQTAFAVGLNLGTGVQVQGTSRINTQGTLSRTDNVFDLALDGDGFFQVELPPGGQIGFTRAGNFALANDGTLITSQGYASRDALVGEGTLTLRFGTVSGASFTPDAARAVAAIAVTATDTLATLATKINQASSGAVQAYVADGTSGARLVMKGREGAANGFVLEAAGAGGAAAPGDLSYISWEPATNAGELQTAARDAVFRLDTVERTSSTNRITGLPGWFALNLTATNTGAPTNLSFASNTDAIASVMNDFVAALNDIVSQLADVAAPIGGALGNDPGARELRRDLAGLASRIVMPAAADGEPRTLADLGLALNRDGSFRLDSARLTRSLETSPDAVAAMFTTGISGVFATMDRFARETSFVSDPGSLGGSLKRFETQQAASDERLAKIAEQQDYLRERLTREFTASERRVAASQSTLAFLRQQVDIWSNGDR